MKQNPYVLAIVKQAGVWGMVKNLLSGALRTGATPIAGEVTAARAASTGFRPAGMAGGRFSPPPGVPRPARAGGPGTSLVPVTAKPNLPAVNTPPKAGPARAGGPGTSLVPVTAKPNLPAVNTPPKAGPTQAAPPKAGPTQAAPPKAGPAQAAPPKAGPAQAAPASFGSKALNWARANPLKLLLAHTLQVG